MSSRTATFAESSPGSDMSRLSVNIANDLNQLHGQQFTPDFTKQQQSHAGILLKLTVENFMNFSSLSVNFNPKVNFITGPKDSGKSALQKAIQEVFRSDSATSKQFIKRGCDACLIELVISNTGRRAYQPSLFGSQIILCRTITHENNSIQLKNRNSVISCSDEDLLNLRSLLHIELWNPVLIMDQDIVAGFFSLDAKKRYQLFAQATMIDEIMELASAQTVTPVELAEQQVSHERKLHSLEIDLEGLRTKKKSLERTHIFLLEREKMEADYLTWAKKESNTVAVAEHQLSLRELNVQVAKVEDEILEITRQEFDTCKKMAEVRKTGAKNHEQLIKFNSISRMFGFGELVESLDALPRQWNQRDTHRMVENKSMQVQNQFLGVLDARNVKARMIVNHERREVHIMARPIISSRQSVTNSVLLGEMDINHVNADDRAYFNVALIMALWKVSDSPFFTIDAFDQYLSPVNKHYIMELFLLTAKEKSKCQFIFFMPDIPPFVLPSDTLSVFKLRSPEENQCNRRRKHSQMNSGASISTKRGK